MTPVAFFAIDPGLAKVGGSGWSYFVDGGVRAAGVLRNLKAWPELGQRLRGQRALFDAVRRHYDLDAPVVSEWMTKRYGPAARKMDVQDLIDLNALSGHLGTAWVTPTEWKGGVPRKVEISRSMMVLSASEKKIVETVLATLPKGVHKEVTSSIGIGLSVAGRAHKKVGWPV